MIKKSDLYIANAHRINFPLVAAVKAAILAGTTIIEDGSIWSLATEVGTGTVFAPFGAESVHGYVTISSFKRDNLKGEKGRDTISDTMQIACLLGPFKLETDQYVTTDTFTVGGFVKGAANAATTHSGGLLGAWDSATDSAEDIIGEVFQVPNADSGVLLGIMGK